MAIVDDLQQIAPLLLRERSEPPVVEDQELDACEGLEHPAMMAVVDWIFLDAVLAIEPPAPTKTAPDRRRQFRVMEGGKS